MFRWVDKLSDKKILGLLAILFLTLYVFYIGFPSLWDGDDSTHAEFAHQMYEKHNLLAAYFNYSETPSFDKPPLTFWITVFFYHIFGMNEFASRLSSALFGVLGVLLIFLFGRKLFNKRTGVLAALIMSTGFLYFFETQLVLLDTALTFFIMLTLYCFYKGFYEEQRHFYILMGVPVSLGILTKGPVALILAGAIGLITGLYHIVKEHKKINALFNWQLLAGLVLGFLISLPWYVIMWRTYGDAFIASNFGYHMFKRFSTSIESHGGKEWYYYFYYVFILLLGFLPWSANLFASLKLTWKRWTEPSYFFVLIWFGVIFIFFSIAQTKLPGYVLPMLPPVALAIGCWWHQMFVEGKTRTNLWVGNLIQMIAALLLLAIFFYLRPQIPKGYEVIFWAAVLIPATFIAGSLISLIINARSKNPETVFTGTFISFYIFWIVFLLVFMPILQSFHPIKHLAPDLRRRLRPGDQVVVYTLGAHSAPFYIRRHAEVYWDDAHIQQSLQSKSHVFAIIDQKTVSYLKEHHQSYVVISKYGRSYLIANR